MFYRMQMNMPPAGRAGLRQFIRQQQTLYWQFDAQK